MKFFNSALPTILTLLTLSNFANAGVKEAGGGDLCENQIKIIRDDIAHWIQQGGPKDLKLPAEVSTAKYSEAMLAQIGKAKIRCVGKGDSEYPVQVYGTPKICRFDASFLKKTITCDRAAFMALDETQQYVLTHHEYAGLADIERPSQDDSVYTVSNQISKYLVDQVVKRLAVRSVSDPVTSIWQEVKGVNGVAVSQRFVNVLANTKFADCDFDMDEIRPTDQPKVCQGQKYWDIRADVKPKVNNSMTTATGGQGLRELENFEPKSIEFISRLPVGYFNCDKDTAGYGRLSIARDEKTGVDMFRSQLYQFMLQDRDGGFITGAFDATYFLDPGHSFVKKVNFKIGIVHKKNIGQPANPRWADEFVTIKTLTCNSKN